MAKLTKREVESATPPPASGPADRRRWSWLGDGEVPGFGVKVYGTGKKVFAVRYRTQGGRGRLRMLTLGAFGELTVEQARDMARAAKVRVRLGEDPQGERQREAVSVVTVRALMTRWLDDHAKAHRRRWKEDEYRLKRRILPDLGKLHLDDLTPDVVANWHRGIGKSTQVEANRCLETLRAAWRWGEREGLFTSELTDPTKRVKKFRERSRDRWLRKEEVARIMTASQAEDDPQVRAAVPLLLLTGLRKRELLHARWANVDLERGEIRLPETKSGQAQVRILPGPAVTILEGLERRQGSPFVFPSPADTSKPRDDIKRAWERIRKKAGLPDVTLHDLRRTAGSYMAQAGVPLQVIQHVLGHSHPGVTRLYARLASENERQALDTLASALRVPLGLPQAPQATPPLPDRIRALLEESGNNPGALAEGLRALVDWENAPRA